MGRGGGWELGEISTSVSGKTRQVYNLFQDLWNGSFVFFRKGEPGKKLPQNQWKERKKKKKKPPNVFEFFFN